MKMIPELAIARVKGKSILIYGQFAFAAMGTGGLTWELTNYLKIETLGKTPYNLYPWTDIFFHPVESSLWNYIILCLVMNGLGGLLYFGQTRKTIAFLKDGCQLAKTNFLWVTFVLSGLLWFSLSLTPSLLGRITESSIMVILPFLFFIRFDRSAKIQANQK